MRKTNKSATTIKAYVKKSGWKYFSVNFENK